MALTERGIRAETILSALDSMKEARAALQGRRTPEEIASIRTRLTAAIGTIEGFISVAMPDVAVETK